MRIAFVTFGNFDGHATLKRATGMAGPLIGRSHEVHILLEDSPINREKVIMECPEAMIHWHTRGVSPLAERREKQKTLKGIQPDLVWICGVGLRNWVFRPKKSCVVLADHSELYSQVSSGAVRRGSYSALEWAYCFSFDGHICASRYLERFYRNRLKRVRKDPSKVHYSPYAYHPGVIRFDPEGTAKVLARFPGKKIILYLGSFWPNYGFWDMIHAFERLFEMRDDFVAVLAGRGPERERGMNWIKENGMEEKIVLEGYVPEEKISAYFGATHAFLSPLRNTVQDWARCPSKLYMYLPFDRPVVTCAIGEAKELFGDEGYYYAPKDVNALVSRLNEVLDLEDAFCSANAEDHTYEARTECFVDWMDARFSRMKDHKV